MKLGGKGSVLYLCRSSNYWDSGNITPHICIKYYRIQYTQWNILIISGLAQLFWAIPMIKNGERYGT